MKSRWICIELTCRSSNVEWSSTVVLTGQKCPSLDHGIRMDAFYYADMSPCILATPSRAVRKM